ncbi:hypothetical protein [Oceaniradius stylonematis]|uniref:hypothetical protein n=1 Tax=Oceaniradius stylonematis TaxID=2184161 RepID=UPI00273D8346|nr:hypothetical protein [Oceaniradius stylonematis]
MTDFLPEFNTMPLHGQHVGIYRLMDGSDWHQVLKDGKPDLRPTREEALRSAKDCLRDKMNPPIRAETTAKSGKDLIMEAQEARLRRQTDGQQKAFGGVMVNRRLVRVERRR